MANVPDVETNVEARILQGPWQAREIVLDPWSGLAHKAIIGPGTTEITTNNSLAPTWVGKHARRLNAYRVLAAYLSNIARAFLPSGVPADVRDKHREYGDPAVFVETIVAAVLGEEPEIMVAGASEEPTRPTEPEDPGEGASEDERAAFAEESQAFEAAMAEHAERVREFEDAQARQEWIDEWARDERFPLLLPECEADAAGLGDGVYVLGWSAEKRRVRVDIYDPGFYFPVLGDDNEFPNRIHLAWQYEDENDKCFVRRITYDRRRLPEGETVSYPWREPDDPASEWAVYVTDATWPFEEIGDRKVDDFSIEKAEFALDAEGNEIRDLRVGIDFIPVVHIPNTPSRKHHYGTSVITRVAQIFDDLANADSDLEAASGVVGAPPIAVGGHAAGTGQVKHYGPGTVFFTGDGSMSMLDTSDALDALIKYVESLLKRLSVNGQVPEEIMGRVKASDVPSGITLLLSFGPFRSLIRKMRLVRDDKYRLFFRMVQRLSMVGGALESGPDMEISLRFGAYLPTDLQALVDMIAKLVEAHLMSRQTGIRNLAEAGVEYGDDLNAEADAIQHEDFEGASAIADATADESEAGKYLGLRVEDQTEGAQGGGGGAPVPAPGTGEQQ